MGSKSCRLFKTLAGGRERVFLSVLFVDNWPHNIPSPKVELETRTTSNLNSIRFNSREDTYIYIYIYVSIDIEKEDISLQES